MLRPESIRAKFKGKPEHVKLAEEMIKEMPQKAGEKPRSAIEREAVEAVQITPEMLSQIRHEIVLLERGENAIGIFLLDGIPILSPAEVRHG